MHLIFRFFLTYLFGGVSFVPLTLLLIWYLSPQTSEIPEERTKQDKLKAEQESLKHGEPIGYRTLRAGELFYRQNSGKKASYSGWITVTKEFYRFPQINSEDFKSNAENAEMDTESNVLTDGTTGSSGIFSKMMKTGNNSNNHAAGSGVNSVDDENESDPAAHGTGKLRTIRKRNRFFGVIKHGNLFLYSNETQKDVKHAIVLDNYIVALWPRDLTDGQLFTKRSSIVLIKKADKVEEMEHLVDILEGKALNITLPKSSRYLYADTSIEKEDWYFSLLRATSGEYNMTGHSVFDKLNPTLMARPLYCNTSDMIDLIETLNSTEHQLASKWLNALIGKLFLATYKTEEFKTAFKNKIEEKLKKIRTPGFLDQLQIQRIDVGHAAPFITNPRLKSLSPEGDLEVLVNFSYAGKAMVEISTKLFLNIGVGFKQRQFDIIMKITVNKINGELMVKLKSEPSSRLWYTFTGMPDIDLEIEPVLSSRNISYGIITTILENKFKDAIKTSLVYPFFDDFIFYRSPQELFRGGIFDRTVRTKTNEQDIGSSHAMEKPRSGDNLEVEAEKTTISNASVQSKGSINTSCSKHSEQPSQLSTIPSIVDGDESNQQKSTDNVTSEQIKGTVIKSYAKIKQWYKKQPATEDNKTSSKANRVLTVNKEEYNPPEMISNRRRVTPRLESTMDSAKAETFSSGVSHSNARGEAFINLERKRAGSQASKFGSVSSMEDVFRAQRTHASPGSPKMFVNEKYGSVSSNTPNVAEFGAASQPWVKPSPENGNAESFIATSVIGKEMSHEGPDEYQDNVNDLETSQKLSSKRRPPPVMTRVIPSTETKTEYEPI